MRIAVIADIHGNLEALGAVLMDIDQSEIDRIVNLGDSIGYGPEPEEILNLIEKRNIINIIGNHEQAILDETYRLYFMRGAVHSTEQTMRFLTAASLSYLVFLSERAVTGIDGHKVGDPGHPFIGCLLRF